MIVIVTVHGIGFQQPPTATRRGYADGLHAGLRGHLPAGVLGDDPERVAAGETGPVYVSSAWPAASGSREAGLARLGRWGEGRTWSLVQQRPLATAGATVGHVALVYSHVHPEGPDEEPEAAMAALTQYATMGGIVRLALHEVAGAVSMATHRLGRDVGDLLPRSDEGRPPPERAVPADLDGIGVLDVLHEVERDMTAYLCRNELRERVRAFVREALLRIAVRDDVDGLVVIGHSKGSVLVFDAIASTPLPMARRVRALVTAGSPLRKFASLFAWGTDAGNLGAMAGPWVNLWDSADPVADPLGPPIAWRRGDPIPADGPGLFTVRDPETGVERSLEVRDILVDNGQAGGAIAHHYWDNETVLASVAEQVAAALDGGPVAQAISDQNSGK